MFVANQSVKFLQTQCGGQSGRFFGRAIVTPPGIRSESWKVSAAAEMLSRAPPGCLHICVGSRVGTTEVYIGEQCLLTRCSTVVLRKRKLANQNQREIYRLLLVDLSQCYKSHHPSSSH
ncbi:hypothetical protein H257_17787 [Aphanomyces astaci]|uniref:Uncharacterized protein n=1 Tax=Aphanomyces astaci TaxID=112090 RepID=W4FDI4_APHAT|nr:hypothetical protein H257_17787 [Aphanomyces astaci]ETV65530.1 hypothetical protein H257_17787 [Aphanomyces astaci]|eukprot:XP_009845018.1 hypothetical protein H257_17787 [Aphanomyces astaci]